MRHWYQQYHAPEIPYCIIGKVTYGVVTACKVPEGKADYYVKHHGFVVLVKDSEFPVDLYTHQYSDPEILQSNPVRKPYDDDPIDCA